MNILYENEIKFYLIINSHVVLFDEE